MVEAAVGFVVVDDEHRLAEHLGIRHQDVENLRDVPGAVVARKVRVLGIAGGRDQHETWGNVPFCTSALNWLNWERAQTFQAEAGAFAAGMVDVRFVPVQTFWNSALVVAAFSYWAKYSSVLSP